MGIPTRRSEIASPEAPETMRVVRRAEWPSGSSCSDEIAMDCVLVDRFDLELTRVRLMECGGAGASWKGARVRDVEVERCDLSNADWSEATVRRAMVRGAKGVGWQVSGATIEGLVALACKMTMCRAIGATLRGCWFDGCDLRESELEECELDGVVFRDCDLRGARLLRTRLGNVDFRGSRLDGMAVSPECARGAIIGPEQANVFAAALGLRVAPLDRERERED